MTTTQLTADHITAIDHFAQWAIATKTDVMADPDAAMRAWFAWESRQVERVFSDSSFKDRCVGILSGTYDEFRAEA